MIHAHAYTKDDFDRLCSDTLRFERYVQRGGPGDCWLWSGTVTRGGYGAFWTTINGHGREIRAHRFAYMLAHGALPTAPLVIRHSCAVPTCCNPAHLQAGTQQENIDDQMRAGRHLHGERHHTAKLRAADVREIRRLIAAGWSQQQVAQHFGVWRCTIQDILRGKTWRHVC